MNYYVEMYILEGYILYGYAIEVKQNKRKLEYRKINVDKKIKLDTVKGIIEEKELQDLCSKIKKQTFTLHNSVGEVNGGLIYRPSIILKSKEDNENQNGSILKNTSRMSSFWNIDKEMLIKNIIKSNDNTSKPRNKLDSILNKLNQVTGMNFKSTALNKLGNFEIYYPLIKKCKFEISKLDDKSIYIEKIEKMDRKLVIGCKLYNSNDRILDQVKELHENEAGIQFNSSEYITGVKIKVWDKSNSDLLYENEFTYMAAIHTKINFINRKIKIEDDWTKELENSYVKGKEQIDQIKCVKKYTSMDTEFMNQSDINNSLVQEINRIPMIKKKYIKSNSKGFFIEEPKDKSGEIKSFIKIREYIDNNNLEKCIILDPFFSIKSAQKILSRIENEGMVLEIISSLGSKDPDTNNKSEDILSEVKTFIYSNINIIHRNLKFYNITSGKNQAFHDRYIIRFFKNGSIDGFMMSNSLNSMGQSYPFSVVPLESEVLFNICEYIDSLKFNKQYKNLEIYNYELQIKKNDNTKKLNNNINKDNEVQIYNYSKNELSDILSKYKISNVNERKKILIDISNILYFSNKIKVTDVATIIECENLNIDELTRFILELVIEAEEDKDKEKNMEWLSMRAYVSRLIDEDLTYDDLKTSIINPPTIYRFKLGNVYMLCKLLVDINNKNIIQLLENSNSVILFIYFIEKIKMYEFNKELYNCMANSSNKCIQKLGYAWLFEHSNKYNKIEEKIKLLEEIGFANDNKELVFYAIGEFSQELNIRKEYQELINILWEKLSNLGDIQQFISRENINDLIEYMNCRYDYINSWNLLRLKEIVNGNNLKILITEKIKYIFESMISKDRMQYNLPEEGMIIYYTAIATIDKYNIMKEDIKSIIKKEDEKDFIRFSKPYISDIDYDTFYKLGYKVMYKCLYFSHIANLCENIVDKGYIINEIIELFKNYVIYNIWELKILNNMILEFINYVFEWIESGLVENQTIIPIVDLCPNWVKCILYLAPKDYSLEKVSNLLLDSYSIKDIKDDIFIVSNIGELLVYKKVNECREEQNIEILKNKFIKMWLDEEDYRKYLICIEQNNLDENLEWKSRGFFYSKCLK